MKDEGVLRVSLVCQDLARGGAARATERLASALIDHAEGRLQVAVRTVEGPQRFPQQRIGLPGGFGGRIRAMDAVLSRMADRLPWGTENQILHSRADVRTGLGKELNKGRSDVANLHWLGSKTLSIKEVARLRMPVVLTLHDMWAFTGSEHYTGDERFVSGYLRDTRPEGESGLDWNQIVWRRKARSWRDPMTVVTPSRWLADCVGRSRLMSNWPVHVIPNPIDLEMWSPLDRREARSRLGLPMNGWVVAFGADGGERKSIKGGDLLREALRRLPDKLTDSSQGDLRLIVFGGKRAFIEKGTLPFPIHHVGRVHDDGVLRAVYSAADAMVVPSRQDNLPNTAVEAQACGTPVVGFCVGGLPDIVEDGVNGRLVAAFDTEALARAIAWVVEQPQRHGRLSAASRRAAIEKFDPVRIAGAYVDVYRAAASNVAG